MHINYRKCCGNYRYCYINSRKCISITVISEIIQMKVLNKWYVLNITKSAKPYDKMTFATLKGPFQY